jgi:rhodanese-related sulfurtransferase
MRALLALILISSLIACRPQEPLPTATQPPETLPTSVKELTVEQAASLIQGTPDLVILDAREEWEIKQDGRIAGALYVDYLNGGRLTENTAKLDPAKPTLIYCAIGERSRRASAILAKKGFTQLSVLSGGFEAWLAAGKPVQK